MMRGLKEALYRVGFFHVDVPIEPPTFDTLARGLGSIRSEFQVRVDPSRKNYVCRPEAIPFHTDDASNRYMAWYCVDQDESVGASLLLDAVEVLAFLTPSEREALEAVQLELPPYARHLGGPASQPLLVQREWGTGVCYSPWLKEFAPTELAANAYEKFRRLIEQADMRQATKSIRLKPGQALFIDNARVLHGRSPLPSKSRRHLRRLWIG